MSRVFKKVVEHFTCTICGRNIEGDGYTNHCPYCLWSRHVDINPGDRQAECGGMMRPTDVTTEKGDQIITHTCVQCSHQKRNKSHWRDDFNALLEVVRERNALNKR